MFICFKLRQKCQLKKSTTKSVSVSAQHKLSPFLACGFFLDFMPISMQHTLSPYLSFEFCPNSMPCCRSWTWRANHGVVVFIIKIFTIKNRGAVRLKQQVSILSPKRRHLAKRAASGRHSGIEDKRTCGLDWRTCCNWQRKVCVRCHFAKKSES